MLSTGRQAAPLLALVCALYYNALDNQFHYDDFHSIVRNPHIRDLGNLPAFFVRPLDGSGIVLVVIGLVAMAQWMADTHFCLELGRRTTRPDLCCAADCPGQRTPSLSVCGGLVFTRGLAL